MLLNTINVISHVSKCWYVKVFVGSGNGFQWPPAREESSPASHYISPHSRTSSPAPMGRNNISSPPNSMRGTMSPVSNTQGSPMTMSPTPTPILKNGMINNGNQSQQQQHVQFRTEQEQQQKQQQKIIPIPVNIINTNRKHCHY